MSALCGRRSTHATTACDQCFRLKVRCDAASPRCTSCERLQQKCTYLRLDKRRVSKVAVSQLFDRIQLLENILKEHNIPVPPPLTLQTRSIPQGASEDGVGPLGIFPRGRWSSISLLTQEEASLEDELCEGCDRERTLIERIDKGNTLASGLDAEIELLAKRTGSLQFTEDGQLKFFGTTSNVHFLRTGLSFQPQIHRWPDVDDTPQTWLQRAGVGHTVPRELEDHLIKLYFTWENPYFNVVEQDAFTDARRQVLSGAGAGNSLISSYYSELLVNAMCSFGALFTDRKVSELPEPLHDFFITRARALLERDIDNPTIATVQALAILSSSEASRSRDSRGWLYDGMASRLALHLGLHLDVEHYVWSGDMTRQEANVRSTAFWGSYVIDLAWSYYLGRLTMPVADVNRIPARTPSQEKNAPPRYWENYTDETATLGVPIQRYIDPVASMWVHQLKLCYIMERLQRTFYDNRTVSISQLRMHTAAVSWALDKWMDDLPPELSIDTNNTSAVYLPHILILHAQYHEAMIFANHPFMTTPGVAQSPDSRRKYIESARVITRIIVIYKRLWSLRRINIQLIHPMFTASMVHLYVACTSENRDMHAAAVSDLEICCDALKDVSELYRPSAWQLRSIDRVRQVWYDLLENHNHDQDVRRPAARATSPEGPERWAAIEAVIKKAMGPSTGNAAPATEQMPWLDTWMQMQSISGVDPFSMGCA